MEWKATDKHHLPYAQVDCEFFFTRFRCMMHFVGIEPIWTNKRNGHSKAIHFQSAIVFVWDKKAKRSEKLKVL